MKMTTNQQTESLNTQSTNNERKLTDYEREHFKKLADQREQAMAELNEVNKRLEDLDLQYRRDRDTLVNEQGQKAVAYHSCNGASLGFSEYLANVYNIDFATETVTYPAGKVMSRERAELIKKQPDC